ncbi:hypothetical protein V6N11_010397 [Hibiscus sabdariffa]|uniref:Uncharacterized protein n=1 Tax=Hibiscus sabdariffa TaxID=183260 RepID=A0ABR2S557_9ROSI
MQLSSYGNDPIMGSGDQGNQREVVRRPVGGVIGATSLKGATGSKEVPIGLSKGVDSTNVKSKSDGNKSVARTSPYPQRQKLQEKKENHNPNMVDVREWIKQTVMALYFHVDAGRSTVSKGGPKQAEVNSRVQW